jgi:hypothetical protein
MVCADGLFVQILQEGRNMGIVNAHLKDTGLHYRTTVLWNLKTCDIYQDIPYETLHNLEKGMIEWVLEFLGK